jgi:hypothetical protein
MRMTLGRERQTEPCCEGDEGQNGHRRDRGRRFIRSIHRRPPISPPLPIDIAVPPSPIDIAIPTISFFGRTVAWNRHRQAP